MQSPASGRSIFSPVMLSPASGRSISVYLLPYIMHHATYHLQAAGVYWSSSACDWETLRSGADLRVTEWSRRHAEPRLGAKHLLSRHAEPRFGAKHLRLLTPVHNASRDLSPSGSRGLLELISLRLGDPSVRGGPQGDGVVQTSCRAPPRGEASSLPSC